jgi:hypothetical protein
MDAANVTGASAITITGIFPVKPGVFFGQKRSLGVKNGHLNITEISHNINNMLNY